MGDALKSTVLGSRRSDGVALLCEFENLAAEGRRIHFDILKNVLADKEIALPEFLFTKHCIDALPPEYMGELLKETRRTRLSELNLCDAVTEGVRLSFEDKSTRMSPHFATLISGAVKQGVPVGLLSTLPAESAASLLDKCGIDADAVTLHAMTAGPSSHQAENSWIQLANHMNVSPAGCLVVCTSQSSSRAALAAQMRCAVACDRYSGFGDFSGCDAVFETLDSAAASAILEMIGPGSL